MTDTPSESKRDETVERRSLPLINEARVAGRITNAVRFEDHGEGKKCARFGLAVPRGGRKREGVPDADFLTITAWGDLRARCEGLGKGDALDIRGRIRTGNDEKGNLKYWGITADEIDVIYRKKNQAADKQERLAGV